MIPLNYFSAQSANLQLFINLSLSLLCANDFIEFEIFLINSEEGKEMSNLTKFHVIGDQSLKLFICVHY